MDPVCQGARTQDKVQKKKGFYLPKRREKSGKLTKLLYTKMCLKNINEPEYL